MQHVEPPQEIDVEALKAQVNDEIAARLLQEADAARYVHRRGFCVGELRLLVPLDSTSEVMAFPPLFRLPGAPKGVRGLANRHGRVVPILDLVVLFGATKENSEGAWVLVYGHGEEAVGIVVDGLPERKKFEPENVVDCAEVSHLSANYAKAAYREGNAVWLDLDMDALLASVFGVELSVE